MRKLITYFLATAALVLSTAAVAAAQTEPVTTTKTTTTTVKKPDGTAQVTKTIQKSDGTYTIIEYPVGKEVSLTLDPIALTGATGTATVLRDPTSTTIKLNLTGLPAEVTSLNLYAVDPAGATTLLGPIAITNGIGAFTTTTPMDKFMLIASPEPTLASYAPQTKIYFRSAVPQGFVVIPLTSNAVGETVSAVAPAVTPVVTTVVTPAETMVVTPAVTPTETTVVTPVVTTVVTPVVTPDLAASAYTVPMLNIPAFKKGDDTKLKVNFSGAMTGARANIFITPRHDGPTEVNFRFHELKEAPAGKIYTVWAVSPENKFVRLGQIANTPGRNEAEIKVETTLPDFGLLVTMEDAADVTTPVGPRIGTVEIIRTN